jgi:Enhancer of rudimentary
MWPSIDARSTDFGQPQGCHVRDTSSARKDARSTNSSITIITSAFHQDHALQENVSALVFDPSIKAYIPCNRDWIKKKTFHHLQQAAEAAAAQ